MLAIILVLSLLLGLLGMNSRLGFWGNFFASVLFTPVVGLLLVIASSSKKHNVKSHKARATRATSRRVICSR